jgi:hypothetical protein
MGSVLGKFYTKAEPRAFGLEVTGYDLKADPPVVLGREMHTGAEGPEIRVALNDATFDRRKSVAEVAQKVGQGGIIRVDRAVPSGTNAYTANWLVPISHAPGHGLLLKAQARVLPFDATNLDKGFKVEVLADAPPARVGTREGLETAIKAALREGQRNALAGSTPVAFVRVMEAADPGAGADMYAVYLQHKAGEDVDTAIDAAVANSRALQAFLRDTGSAVIYPDAMLVEVARATQVVVGKDSVENVAKQAPRYLTSSVKEGSDGARSVTHRSAGFTESFVGLRHMPERTTPGLESPERYIVMNVERTKAKATFSPSGRVDHVEVAHGKVFQEHGEDAPAELPDDFQLEDLPTEDAYDGPSP